MITTIEEYIQQFPEPLQIKLQHLRQVIKNEMPECIEKMSYQMPTFYYLGNLVHFAVAKKHIGFYPAPSAILAFSEELKAYKPSKGAIQFPMDEELPIDLIQRIVRYRVEENQLKEQLKKSKTKGRQ